MKLSKAQQEVVDKMRKGAIIFQNMYTGRVWIRDKQGNNSDMNINCYMALRRNKIIVLVGYSEGFNEHYRLTEQYKTETR